MSFDSQQDNRNFSEKYSFNFPLLCDTERAMGVAYGACDDTSARAAKRIGVVIGTDGKIASYEPKASAANYPSEVLASL